MKRNSRLEFWLNVLALIALLALAFYSSPYEY